jgi:hypothetical protein
MGMYTLIVGIISFLLTLVVDVFAIIPVFNSIVGILKDSDLVISNLDWQVATVISVIIMSIPIAALLFAAIDSFSNIMFKSRTGY